MEKPNHSKGKCCAIDVSARNASEDLLAEKVEGYVDSVFSVSGMDCKDEVNAIADALKKPGIASVRSNIMSSQVTVNHDPKIANPDLKKWIETAGVKVKGEESQGFFTEHRSRIQLVVGAGVLLTIGLVLDWFTSVSEWVLLSIFLASALTGGILIFPKAWRALLAKSLDMNVLMSVAVVGAFSIREYSEGATVVFLFSLAELLEAFSIARARQAIRAVLKLTPQVANLKRDNAVLSVPVFEVNVGDILVVRPGESIPLDGVVSEGASSVNQAPLTGESMLIDKKVGDPLFAGTINSNGMLTFKVTQAFKDTKISRVIQMIEEAQSQKAPSERFVDQFARIYTPVVFAMALFVAFALPFILGQPFETWYYRALVLLVIACPCALVIATPISVVSGLTSLAKQGVLVKGGTHLEALGKVEVVALDKTGTLTEGKFKVQTFTPFGDADEKGALEIAATLESASTHPLAVAVMEFTKAKSANVLPLENYEAVPGRGAQGDLGGVQYFLGNHRFAHELGVCTPEIEAHLQTLEEKALSVVVVGRKPSNGKPGSVIGVFGLGDNVRPNAKLAIEALHRVGVKNILVLSGDNQKTVDAIRKITGIDKGLGDLLPEDKVREIKALTAQYGNVAMVGDGVNDAPALAFATLGVAMGAAGTDAAIETSDVTLMRDDLQGLAIAIAQGRRVLAIIRFNIAFAIAIKAVFLVLAAVGLSNLWMAVGADMGASLFVTFNALRLVRN